MMNKNDIMRAKSRVEEAEGIVAEADQMQVESELMANRAMEAWEVANSLALRATAQRRLAASILNTQYVDIPEDDTTE